MVSSDTDICNFAIANLGTGKIIQDLSSETSQEANVCRLFYSVARDATLRDFPWPFAKATFTLSLVETFTANTDEWLYSYRYPPDCVMIRRIESGCRTDDRDTRVPYDLGADAGGRLIFTDRQNAILVYTTRFESVQHYPDDFVFALAARMSTLIAPSLVRGDLSIVQAMQQLYVQYIVAARANAQSEIQPDRQPNSEFIRARD